MTLILFRAAIRERCWAVRNIEMYVWHKTLYFFEIIFVSARLCVVTLFKRTNPTEGLLIWRYQTTQSNERVCKHRQNRVRGRGQEARVSKPAIRRRVSNISRLMYTFILVEFVLVLGAFWGRGLVSQGSFPNLICLCLQRIWLSFPCWLFLVWLKSVCIMRSNQGTLGSSRVADLS